MSTTSVSANRIRILTVDDHPLILEGIAGVLHRQPDMELVGEASDGYEAIEAFAKLRPDVALIDLQMPGMNGIDTIIAILEKWPDARCVVLTTYAGDVQAIKDRFGNRFPALSKSEELRVWLAANPGSI